MLRSAPRTIFITGTDTGVGKTLLTASLLIHLRQTGHHALAIKPFCTGSRADADLLHSLQASELSLDQINPFYFPEPLAPLVAARKHRRSIPMAKVLQYIQQLRKTLPHSTVEPRPSTILVEGAGGLLVPLGDSYTWADVVQKLGCHVVVASANRLGTINHTLLTARAIQAINHQGLKVVMMDVFSPLHVTPDTRQNSQILAELLAPIPVHQLPFLGSNPLHPQALKKNQEKIKNVLAQILASDKLFSVAQGNSDKKKENL